MQLNGQNQTKSYHHGKKHVFCKEEDEMILRLVQKYGTLNWKQIACHLKNRTARQIRERYENFIAPGINKLPWIQAGDDLLIQLHNCLGGQWKLMSLYFNNRPPVSLKNRYNALKRKSNKNHKEVEEIAASVQEEPAQVFPDFIEFDEEEPFIPFDMNF